MRDSAEPPSDAFWAGDDGAQRYRRLLDAVGDGVYRLDADGRFVGVNDALAELTGFSRERLHGEAASVLFDAADRDRLAEGLAADDGLATVHVETASGDAVPCEVRVSAADGGHVGVVREVSESEDAETPPASTDRERAAGDLRDTAEQFQSLVGAVEEYAIFRLDPDGTVISWNEGAREIKGYDADEILGEHFSTFYTESDREAGVPERNLERAFEDGSVEDEGWRVRADGSRFWANVTITAVRDDDGSHRGFLKVTRDMTDRHRRERELEAELDHVLGRVSDAFYAVDETFQFTHVNERAEQLLGHSAEELVGTTMWDVFPEGPGSELYDRFRHALAQQESASFERQFEPLDIWAEVNVYPSETGLSVYLRDVTERREYERALEASNERLEQFAYAASHDLQEPLRMVSSYLQLLENRYGDELDSDAEEFLEFAVDGAERMKAMIDGLLEYSRIETRGSPLEPTDLASVLSDVRTDLQFRIEETDAELTADSLPTVRGDEDQLRQVFQNLLDNAIEYSGETRPRVHVSAERDGDRWRIDVEDEGIGIDADDQTRIFEVFQRLHTHEDHEGTGIGLALCRRIVERHGGDIWVESEPGEGATFSFTLPAVEE